MKARRDVSTIVLDKKRRKEIRQEKKKERIQNTKNFRAKFFGCSHCWSGLMLARNNTRPVSFLNLQFDDDSFFKAVSCITRLFAVSITLEIKMQRKPI